MYSLPTELKGLRELHRVRAEADAWYWRKSPSSRLSFIQGPLQSTVVSLKSTARSAGTDYCICISITPNIPTLMQGSHSFSFALELVIPCLSQRYAMWQQNSRLHADCSSFALRQNITARIVKMAQPQFLCPDSIALPAYPPAAEQQTFLKKEASVYSMVLVSSL